MLQNISQQQTPNKAINENYLQNHSSQQFFSLNLTKNNISNQQLSNHQLVYSTSIEQKFDLVQLDQIGSVETSHLSIQPFTIRDSTFQPYNLERVSPAVKCRRRKCSAFHQETKENHKHTKSTAQPIIFSPRRIDIVLNQEDSIQLFATKNIKKESTFFYANYNKSKKKSFSIHSMHFIKSHFSPEKHIKSMRDIEKQKGLLKNKKIQEVLTLSDLSINCKNETIFLRKSHNQIDQEKMMQVNKSNRLKRKIWTASLDRRKSNIFENNKPNYEHLAKDYLKMMAKNIK